MVDQNRPFKSFPMQRRAKPSLLPSGVNIVWELRSQQRMFPTPGPWGPVGGVESIAWTTKPDRPDWVCPIFEYLVDHQQGITMVISHLLAGALYTQIQTCTNDLGCPRRAHEPNLCQELVRRKVLTSVTIAKHRWTGWWYTYPSEKYDFVSWDNCSQCMESHKSHVPVTTNITKQWKIRWQALYEKVGIPASCCFKLTAPGVGHPFFPRYLDPKRTISAHQPGSVTGCHRA